MHGLWIELKEKGTNNLLIHGQLLEYKNTLNCYTKKERTPTLGALIRVVYF
tara:strand:+ start:1161 stop:1313 length:153 start_codon:yes stop_codon:yes gene_type:complete